MRRGRGYQAMAAWSEPPPTAGCKAAGHCNQCLAIGWPAATPTDALQRQPSLQQQAGSIGSTGGCNQGPVVLAKGKQDRSGSAWVLQGCPLLPPSFQHRRTITTPQQLAGAASNHVSRGTEASGIHSVSWVLTERWQQPSPGRRILAAAMAGCLLQVPPVAAQRARLMFQRHKAYR